MPPQQLHATYAGIAQAMSADSAPVLLWGTAQAHICLGQSQSAAQELAPQLAVPIVRRPLGGGTVWVDEGQLVYVLIVPLHLAPQRPADWGAWALQPAIATFRQFGLDVERQGEDLWLRERKIAGTGSATIGRAAVYASSFLMRFPHERFADCIAGSPEFRCWLAEGLKATLTDWAAHAPVPAAADLRENFCREVESAWGWRLHCAGVTADEASAIGEVQSEMHDDGCGSDQRAFRDGLKLNAESHLVERNENGRRVRELVVRGKVSRRAVVTL